MIKVTKKMIAEGNPRIARPRPTVPDTCPTRCVPMIGQKYVKSNLGHLFLRNEKQCKRVRTCY